MALAATPRDSCASIASRTATGDAQMEHATRLVGDLTVHTVTQMRLRINWPARPRLECPRERGTSAQQACLPLSTAARSVTVDACCPAAVPFSYSLFSPPPIVM